MSATVVSDLRTKVIRRVVALATLLLTAAATGSFVAIALGNGDWNLFEVLSAPLFAILFAWIAFSFCLATVGFLSLARQNWRAWRQTNDSEYLGDHPDQTVQRTAVLMPVYNESPTRVFAGIKAMIQELRARGIGDAFAFYVLSDTTDHETWIAEEMAWADLVETLDAGDCLFYRHRPHNKSRKAGNIADFVERWGAHHEFMIVLDADSLVSASTMNAMVQRMRADTKLGILQVPPVPIGRNSLFARMQQFAASVYGPIFVQGFAVWAGNEGNYWGHNAIIRVEAFRRHCDLPVLPGSAPLGGEILSHDFVEAALMLRAGWKVQVATDLAGSFEECPTTIADYAQRDQRWCQGNLQHSKLLVAEDFRPLSRMHFSCGLMSYLASPLWILFTLMCIAAMALDAWTHKQTVPSDAALGALIIFSVSMALLLLPKLWSVLLIFFSREHVNQHGGYFRLAASALFETVMSVLLSPIMAIYHTRFVLAVLRGTNVKWNSQQRDERGVSWREAVMQMSALTLGGILASLVIYSTAPELFLWFSPLIAGVILSIPIVVAMGSQRIGLWLHRHGLLLVPSETNPPPVCVYHKLALQEKPSDHRVCETANWFTETILNPRVFALHTAILRSTSSDNAMPQHESKAIEATAAAKGIAAIPVSARKAILSDSATLTRLHREAQLALIDRRQDNTQRDRVTLD
ncbi:glucans biosynthesis glucosyltransferase MdoH [Stieleria varia]|uniref:Glucans biosynthesis glucosyltransferase H n=1 Tax=Stieleria varia TaxID=2528005 RepID=A0A5C6AV96_9BACT|nr:glucans biosynthesis glucosyltransferase MdoH [Stieleria varia]TWU02966.1 Glucans biosynthesis glucosyltransferase H [Stieleria varia]